MAAAGRKGVATRATTPAACRSSSPCAWPACGTSTTRCSCPRAVRRARSGSESRCTSCSLRWRSPARSSCATAASRCGSSRCPGARDRDGASSTATNASAPRPRSRSSCWPRSASTVLAPGRGCAQARLRDREGGEERDTEGRPGALPRLRTSRDFMPGASRSSRSAVVRVVHTLAVAPWPPQVFNDELYYATLARARAAARASSGRPSSSPGELQIPTAERAPLFPLALAGLAELGVTGSDARLLVLTGPGSIAVLGLLARRLAGDRAGLIAAGLAALHPTLIAADGALMTESLYGLLAALALLAAYRVVESPAVAAPGARPRRGRRPCGAARGRSADPAAAAARAARAPARRGAPRRSWSRPSPPCSRRGRRATGASSTARCSSRPRAGRRLPARTAPMIYFGGSRRLETCVAPSSPGAATRRPPGSTGRAVAGCEYALDHLDRAARRRVARLGRSLGPTATASTCPRAAGRGSCTPASRSLPAAAAARRLRPGPAAPPRGRVLDHRHALLTVTVTTLLPTARCASATRQSCRSWCSPRSRSPGYGCPPGEAGQRARSDHGTWRVASP